MKRTRVNLFLVIKIICDCGNCLINLIFHYFFINIQSGVFLTRDRKLHLRSYPTDGRICELFTACNACIQWGWISLRNDIIVFRLKSKANIRKVA